jgi:uncharacterized damage-inducible protein DinB
MTRTDLPVTWDDERTMLMTFLDYGRQTALAKCEGLSQAGATDNPLPGSPAMSVAGVVHHLRWVETWWLEVVLLGGEDLSPPTEAEPDRDFTAGTELPLAEVLADYAAESARLDALVADVDLGTMSTRSIREGHVPLRWILHHLIEETARHNGHLDILRELADSETGV